MEMGEGDEWEREGLNSIKLWNFERVELGVFISREKILLWVGKKLGGFSFSL